MILFRAVHEKAVFPDGLAVFEKRTIFFVCDVDDMACEFEVRVFFSKEVGEALDFFVFLHLIPDVEYIEMNGRKVEGLSPIKGFLVSNRAEE